MKKSLIALAVIAASGAAMAQSSVTLYGIADVWVGQESVTNSAGVKTKQTKVESGGFNSSRWGLKGSEDLGGGLNAIFTLESGFNIDTGAVTQTGVLFNRQAFVGVQGAFGAVTLGRQYTAYDELRGATNQAFDSAFAATGSVWANGIEDYADRANNSIAYTSPSFGGVSGAVVVGLGENKASGLKATKNYSANIKYANGPLMVGYAHQVQDSRIAATAPGVTPVVLAAFNTEEIKYNLIAGSYDFGVAALTGGYNDVKQGNAKDKEYQLGVSVPFGAASVAVGYAHSKHEAAGMTTNAEGYNLTGLYDLSKRTRLYAGLSNTKQKESSDKISLFAVGVRHSF
jgi:predicted porin